METTEKILTIRIDGVDKALKSSEQLKKEYAVVENLLDKIGKSKSKENIKALHREMEALSAEFKKQATQLDSLTKELDDYKNKLKEVENQEKKTTAETQRGLNAKNGRGIAKGNIGSLVQSGAGFLGGGLAGFALGLASPMIEEVTKSMLEFIGVIENANSESAIFKEVTSEVSNELGKELYQLDSLFQPLSDTNALESEKADAIEKVNEQYKDYLPYLITEKTSQEELAVAMEVVRQQLIKNTIERVKAAKAEQIYSQILDLQLKRQQILSKGGTGLSGVFGLDAGIISNIDSQIKELNGSLSTLDQVAEDVKFNLTFTPQGTGILGLTGFVEDLTTKLKAAQIVASGKTGVDTGGKGKSGKEKEINDAQISKDLLKEQLDLLQELAKNGTVEEVEKQIATLQPLITQTTELIDKETKAYKGNSELIEKNIKQKEALAKESAKLAEELKKEEAAALHLIFSENKELDPLKIETIDSRRKKLITSTGLNIDELKIQLSKFAKESGNDFKRFYELIEKYNAENTSQIQLNEVLTRKERQETIRQEIEGLDKTIELQKAAAEKQINSQQTVAEFTKQIEEDILQAKQNISDRELKNTEDSLKTLLVITKSAGDARIAAGLQTLENEKTASLRKYDESIAQIEQAISPILDNFKKLYGIDELFVINDGIVELNTSKLKEKFNGDERLFNEAATNITNAIKESNSQRRALTINYNTELKNLNNKFVEEYLSAYRQRNKAELDQLKADLELKKITTTEYEERLYNITVDFAENALRVKRKLAKDDIQSIRQNKEEALKATRELYEAEDADRAANTLKAIQEAKDKGADVRLIETQEAAETARIQAKRRKEIDAINKKYDKLTEDQRKQQEQKTRQTIQQFLTYIQQVGQIIQGIYNLVIQGMQATLDELTNKISEIDSQLQDSQSKLNALEDDLAGKRSGRRDAVLQQIEQEKEREIDLANKKRELERQAEVQRKKIAKERKEAALAQAIINTAVAVTNGLLMQPFIPVGIAAGASAGILGGIEIATIANTKYAKGGYTGKGGATDETGHKVAGVVHNDEWVAPKWMVESPQFSGTIQNLESSRKRGFASGGYTNENANYNSISNAVSNNNNLEKMINNYMQATLALANRPIIANAKEFTNVSTEQYRKVNTNTIGG